jgi:predicted nucleic acid-binding protein
VGAILEDMYLDSDFIISFIRSNIEDYFNIFQEVCKGYRIIVPKEVQTELLRREERIICRINSLIKSKVVELYEMRVDEMAYLFKFKLQQCAPRHKRIGSGEAAAIALCADKRGILASNNLRDVSRQIGIQRLKHITTSRVLGQAYAIGLIDMNKAEEIWADMLSYGTYLPEKSFNAFLERKEPWPLK